MVTSNYKNPAIVAVPDPIDLDYAILRVQVKVAALPWLEKVFGRAFEITRKSQDGKTVNREPMVYVGNGEYASCLPNDALKAYAFFVCAQPRDIVDHRPMSSPHFMMQPTSIIVWGNHKRVDPTRDTISREIQINQVLTQLNSDPKIRLARVTDENARDIFRGFTLNETHQGLLMHPYFAFRIEFNLHYQTNCTAPLAYQSPPSETNWNIEDGSTNWEDLL